MIQVRHLDKYFNKNKRNQIHVINDITIDFPEKGLVVLLGPSGSGKTTLLNVLGGLDKVQSGTVSFGDREISRYKASTWDAIRNEDVGYIFQNYNLLPQYSVFDNIAFVLKMIGITDPDTVEQRVNYILNAVNMYPFRKKRALQLSGGQQQRVAIARALVKNPKVIIADEPTGNLDSKNSLEIMNIIKAISMEKLVVLVTHEKDLARFYGDRIIEIKDGRIESDTTNDASEDHGMKTDDTIYLKDLHKLSSASDEGLSTELYVDHPEDHTPVNVRLIVKNRTLYIDVGTDIKKVKLVDPSAGVTIRGEAFVKKTREEMIETSFDLDSLDNTAIKRQKPVLTNLKQAFFMAFRKLSRTGRKGKIMLFSFFVAGAVIAVAVSMVATLLIIEPEQYMLMPEGYVSVFKNVTHEGGITVDDEEAMLYEDLLGLKNSTDELFYINTFTNITLTFLNPDGSLSSLAISDMVDTTQGVRESDLVSGRLPLTTHEILISETKADEILGSRTGQEMGIWNHDYIFYETLSAQGQEIRIVGITDSKISIIYMDPVLANIIQPVQFNDTVDGKSLSGTALSLHLFDGEILHGALPDEGEYLVSKQLFEAVESPVIPDTFPYRIDALDIVISGLFRVQDTVDISRIYMNDADLEELRFQTGYQVFVRTDDPVDLVDDIQNLGYEAYDLYTDAYDNAKSDNRTALAVMGSLIAFVIGFSFLGFYFVIRSSLIERIYEVSVYRALGVRKSNIMFSFIVEIFMITSISTLIGYGVATIGVNRLVQGLLGEFNFFKVTPLSVLVGIAVLYGLNLLAGLMPVFNLLRRTPAQILSQYDI
jgi:putative ABC transport system permease protein